MPALLFIIFFFNAPAPTEIYTLSLHDALPIYRPDRRDPRDHLRDQGQAARQGPCRPLGLHHERDRKSTRLNSSHVEISYAVFCLKKKKKNSNLRRIAIRETYAARQPSRQKRHT